MKSNYTIDYQGLSLGEHHFSFDLSREGLAPWQGSDIQDGEGKIEIDLLRHANFMELDVTITGSVELECDRCTDLYTQPIDFDGQVVVKISPTAVAEPSDGDIIWINPADGCLDLGQWIYESIVLSLPVQRAHPDKKDCNQEVIKYINSEL
ncbi:MAG: DUF177 domain-containing protein [Mucinivorans sp.]